MSEIEEDNTRAIRIKHTVKNADRITLNYTDSDSQSFIDLVTR